MERIMYGLGDIPSARQRFNFNPQPIPRQAPPQPRPMDGPLPSSQPRPRPMDGPIPSSQPRPHPMDGPLPQPAPSQPRWFDGPRSFASSYAPQIQRLEQRFPGFASNARQMWQQARQQQGPGFWRNYITPGAGAQQNFPGLINLFQGAFGQAPPQKMMNFGQRRGWLPTSQPRPHWLDR